MPEEFKIPDNPTYRIASQKVDEWLSKHKDEKFRRDDIYADFQIQKDPVKRDLVTQKLFHEVKAGRLEKINNIYRYINNTILYINWTDVGTNDALKIGFPYGVDDNSVFSFANTVEISPGDIIVVAGRSNSGKTCFLMNMLWENMDDFASLYMGNEVTPQRFARRAAKMTWRNPLRDGKPKFEVVERYENWKDIIQPDSINYIDWINLDQDPYKIGSILEGIKSKLKKGICVVALQKNPEKQVGTGGQYSVHLSSLYLAMDYNLLTVYKCKGFSTFDPNGLTYSFKIVNYGSQFHDIRQVEKCPKCHGYCLTSGKNCDTCNSTGFVERGVR